MYALVEIKGKQYKAVKGEYLTVDLFSEDAGTAVELDKVLLLSGDSDVKTGTPYVKGASVKAVIKDSYKGKKINILKFKRRKNYEIKKGHRQGYTRLQIEDIVGA